MKKSRNRVLFVHYSFTSFIKKDFEMLDKHYNVKKIAWKGKRSILSVARNVFKTDLVFSWFAGDASAVAVFFSRLFRKKSVIIVGGIDVQNIPEFNYGQFTQGWLKRFLTRYAVKHADVVLPVSDYIKDEMLKRTKPKSYEIIYNGVDTEKFVPKGNKEKIVVTIGNVTEDRIRIKGLETFDRASKSFPDYKFVIIGKYEETMKEKLQEINPDLIFTGRINHEEVLDWLQRAKIYCQLSYVESFGLGVAEAMSCNCIPIVTNRGALPEIVGKTGFYVEYGSEKQTIDAIKKAVNSKNKTRDSVEQLFSIKKREAKIIKKIGSLIKG